eukprot:6182669-Pleurochrysis_carterae.AAC.1
MKPLQERAASACTLPSCISLVLGRRPQSGARSSGVRLPVLSASRRIRGCPDFPASRSKQRTQVLIMTTIVA